MITVSSTVACRAPIEAVEAIILDPDLAPEWTDGLMAFEVVEGRAGVPGCVGRAHYRGSFGRTSVMTDTLEAADPGRYYRSRITGGPITATVETFLEPTADGCTISIRWTGVGSTLVANATMRVLRRGIERRARSDLERLAALVEPRASSAG